MEIGPFKYDDIEEFKQRYILEKAQLFALKEKYSYYDVRTSNVDGTFIGEEFDRLAEEHFKIDKQRSIEKYGEP